jgi:Trk K+ transport system NAD-binding subunit
MSTVGFGDVTAHYTTTKIITLILIANGITSIGITSQLLLDRIVKFQLSKQKLLPTKPLSLSNHIIIAGYGSKSRRLARLFSDRFYEVIIVESDETRAVLAEFNGYRVIQGDITKPSVLDILSLSSASALCLLLSNDSITIQTGILARSRSNDIDIYAEIKSSAAYDIARIAGINKPIPFIPFMTNALQNHLSHANIELFFNLKELHQQEANLGYALVHLDLNYMDLFQEAYRLGLYSFSLNELYLDYKSNISTDNIDKSNHLLLAVDRLELIKSYKGENTEQIPHKRIVFAGYSELAEAVFQRLEHKDDDIVILWKSEQERDLAESINCKKMRWKFEEANNILEEIIQFDDLVVCSFDDITESLVLAVTLNNLDRGCHLVQVVPYEYEVEPFIKVGADAAITPQQVISEAILSIFMKDNQLPPSIIFKNGHIFEYQVEKDDQYDNMRIKAISNEKKQIMFIKTHADDKFRPPKISEKLHVGNRILVVISY